MVESVIPYILEKLENAKLETDPFKYLVIKDFIPEEYGRKLVKEYPNEDHKYWTRSKTTTRVNSNKGNTVGRKLMCNEANSDVLLPKNLRDLIYFLNGQTVCNSLAEKFGFESKTLISDPQLEGGGLHSLGRYGYLEIHADFNYHPHHKMHRRLNLLLYLNYDWNTEWGGDVELWDTQCKEMKVKVPPLGGHCVVFATNDDSYHGHPYPLTCPEGTRRNSIALYYYNFPEHLKEQVNEKTRTTKYIVKNKGIKPQTKGIK
jgi:hypothetical protein